MGYYSGYNRLNNPLTKNFSNLRLHKSYYPERHLLGGGFKYVLFSPLFGEDSHFDQYFSNGLKPPTSLSIDQLFHQLSINKWDLRPQWTPKGLGVQTRWVDFFLHRMRLQPSFRGEMQTLEATLLEKMWAFNPIVLIPAIIISQK